MKVAAVSSRGCGFRSTRAPSHHDPGAIELALAADGAVDIPTLRSLDSQLGGDGMTIGAVQDSAEGSAGQPAYARFMPRLRALYIDAIIMMVVAFGILFVAVTLRSDNVARVLGFTIVVSWLLYEPLLVSFAGGTIGHRRTNLRVVDDRTQGNVGLLKSFARTVIKAALGWVSFVTMLTTRRSQAMHDLLTRSTVQVRDLSLAGPRLYVHERPDFAPAVMPSRMRRVLVIGAYVVAALVLLVVLELFLLQSSFVSDRCISTDRCTFREKMMSGMPVVVWLAVCVLSVGLGWRGRLFGCRAARV
jgi:uncharacterized RDD family membrane protein YckC